MSRANTISRLRLCLPPTVDADESVAAVARRFDEPGVRELLVTRGDVVLGLLRADDLLAIDLLDRDLRARTAVHELVAGRGPRLGWLPEPAA